MGNYIYSMKDVLDILAQDYGYTKLQGSSTGEFRCLCPKCGGKKIDKDFCINMDNEKFICHKCGFSGRFSTNLYAGLLGINRADADKEIRNRLGITKDQAFPKRIRTAAHPNASAEVETATEAPIERKNSVNRATLRCLCLEKDDLDDLLERGLVEREISELGYKTYPGDDIQTTWKVINTVTKDNNLDPEGVPMWYKTPKKAQWMINYPQKSVVMVKYMTFDNNLAAFQGRRRNEDIKPGEEKYFWFTSNGKNHGAKPTHMVHYACDFEKNEEGKWQPMIYLGPSGKKYMCITEGAMKADIAHMISGKPFIAIPGVSIQRGIEDDLPRLKKLGVTDFIICFDTDQIMNINVLKAQDKLAKMLSDYGFGVQNGTIWDLNYEQADHSIARFDLDNDFVFTRKTLHDAIENETLESVLSDVCSLSRKSVIFAVPDAFTNEDKDLYSTLLSKAKTGGFTSCRYAKYHITLKGIDDFYACRMRNVQYA